MSTTLAERRRTIRELCGLYGVETRYRNIEGVTVAASETALLGVLSALGIDTSSDATLGVELALRAEEHAGRLLEPVVVVAHGSAARVSLGGVSSRSLTGARVELTTEEGERVERRFAAVAGGHPGTPSIDLGGLALPVGVHRLALTSRKLDAQAHVFVTPPKPPRPRRAFGVFAPLYGLRSATDWGIGSLTELDRLGRWAERHGAGFVGTLPLYAAFYTEPFEVSPYLPVSRVAWNEIFLDIPALPELAAAPEAAAVMANRVFARAVASLRSADRVEYREVARRKREVLEIFAGAVDRGPRAGRFAAFLAGSPTIREYARFRAEHEGGPADQRLGARRYHEYVQFATAEALASLRGLYLDLPVGVHPDGFDRAHFGAAFVDGASVGAPPDDFFTGGQDWAMPAPHPERAREDGHAYWRATLGHVMAAASVVRIDHVMGLERLWFVPSGHAAADGAYVRSPSRELRAAVAIEAYRHGTVVVGEDLGTVPPATRRGMAHDGMLRSFVYQMEASPARPAPRAPRDALASFGTHDTPRFWSFATGADLAERVASGARTKEDGAREQQRRRSLRTELEARGDAERGVARAYRGILSWLSDSAAVLALVDLGDLVGDPESENRPGPRSGETSWRHRLPATLEALEAGTVADRRLALVARGRDSGHEKEER